MGESQHQDPGSYFLELRNHFFSFFGVKILKFFDEDPGFGFRDGDSSDPGSGMEKSRIRDKNPGSAPLLFLYLFKKEKETCYLPFL
jgi:hypothetical protein